MTTAKTVVSEDYLQDLIASEKRLRAENENLREVLNDVTKELDQFVNIFKGYQGMKMNNAQAALRAAAAALNGAVNE